MFVGIARPMPCGGANGSPNGSSPGMMRLGPCCVTGGPNGSLNEGADFGASLVIDARISYGSMRIQSPDFSA